MPVDVDAIASSLATKFGPGLGLPSGITEDIAIATANPPNAVTETPAVVVFTDSGSLAQGNQWRGGVIRFRVQFLLRLGVDIARDEIELRRWLGTGVDDSGLLYRLRPAAALTLGGNVTRCQVSSFSIGGIKYNDGDSYSGIELLVDAVTREAWTPS